MNYAAPPFQTIKPDSRKAYEKLYLEMCALWEMQDYGDVATDYLDFAKENPALVNVLNLGPCVTWIIDVRRMQYLFMSSNVKAALGYDACLFTTKGIAFVNEITHPDDLPKTWGLIKKIWDFLLAQPASKRKQYQFNHDYRMAKVDGSYIRVLEQSSILQQDSNGNITHVMGVCSDITHLKKNETLTASLISTGDNSCIFFTPETDGINPQDVLSKRELEIVKLIAEGYSSKLIADKLCIGFSTVNTHRQNIIRKTNTRNTGEFVQFAIGNGLI
ncbi:PAS domain-containing protein [Adhaeribacter sp. BT258]|uniref:PAS domain-containing protein n=1 Tax=Adhaeribacter terrigena TaxID=2793070 RepID=A0ABS1C0T2_9BACT|nr:LuxR C-terminal-related transcriptional regulator [Adhaeribacter terrigena]MBK0403015.1 PAS domain-containing protein [Adhaeribacter terrigena]